METKNEDMLLDENVSDDETAEDKKWTLVVGVKFSECGTRALGQALTLAHRGNGVLHIAHAITTSDLGVGVPMKRQEAALEELPAMITRMVIADMDRLGIEYEEVPVELHVRLGSAFDVVRQVAIDYQADLLVVGTPRHSGMKKLLLGSVTEQLVQYAHVPVLVAHDNRLGELEKTTFPDPMRSPEEETHRDASEDPHVYHSTLISAWRGLGRPTNPMMP
jgi:nucleotide-binding universal stress UspA family protein